jgi:hypothetical protein
MYIYIHTYINIYIYIYIHRYSTQTEAEPEGQLQGYLTHKKLLPPRTLQYDHAQGPTCGSGGFL